ncbi:MAG: mechanosensitive ion channel [Bacteroidales bacterium]|nr:mechanosensitive ion channel [Bacteroidales bacterium]
MLLLDDNNTQMLMAAAAQKGPKGEMPVDEFGQTLMTQDSVAQVVKDSLSNMNLAEIKDVVTGENTLLKDGLKTFVDMTVGFVPKLIIAILVLWVGLKLTKLLKRSIIKLLDKRSAEPSLKSFLASLVDVLLKVMLVIMVMDIIGIKATSFIAVLGAAGLAVGMALQGTLQNFAGGVIILLMKPFKVGDYIECGTFKGYVKEIRIFHTFMQPFNGRTIIVPNSSLATTSLINHTKQPEIRLDVVASVAYGTDLDYAKGVLKDIIDSDPLILKEPAAKIAVSELGSSSVNFSLWMWVKTEDYWTVWMRIREEIYNGFREKGISIPFPQMDVHVSK